MNILKNKIIGLSVPKYINGSNSFLQHTAEPLPPNTLFRLNLSGNKTLVPKTRMIYLPELGGQKVLCRFEREKGKLFAYLDRLDETGQVQGLAATFKFEKFKTPEESGILGVFRRTDRKRKPKKIKVYATHHSSRKYYTLKAEPARINRNNLHSFLFDKRAALPAPKRFTAPKNRLITPAPSCKQLHLKPIFANKRITVNFRRKNTEIFLDVTTIEKGTKEIIRFTYKFIPYTEPIYTKDNHGRKRIHVGYFKKVGSF